MDTDRKRGLKGEKDAVLKKIKNIDQKTGLACPAVGETNGSSSVSAAAYIWCVSLSICACHAPLLPMYDNYPAPDCVNNKKTRPHEATSRQCCSTKLSLSASCGGCVPGPEHANST